MGHNLENKGARKEDASFFHVTSDRKPAWHELGKNISEYPSMTDALKFMCADYEVLKVPAQYKGNDVPGRFWTVRADNDAVLGLVGDRYTICQNRKGFDLLDTITGMSDALRESGGVFGLGESVFMCCKLRTTCKVADDLIDCYFVFLNSHDGSGKIRVIVTPIRPVCQNTVNLGIASARRIYCFKHTANFEERVKEAANAVGVIKNYYTKFTDVAASLLAKKSNEAQFFALMDQLMPAPGDDASKRSGTIYERERNKMIKCYYADDLENIRETAWGEYNAIADYSDHYRESRGENSAANTFIRTFESTDIKDRAGELLIARR